MIKSRFIVLHGCMLTGILIAALFLSACASQATVVRRNPTLKLHLPPSMVLDTSISSGEEKVYWDSLRHTIMAFTVSKSAFTSVDNYLSCSWKDLDVRLRGLSEDSTFQLISCEKTKLATVLTYSVSPQGRYYPYCILYFIHRKSFELQFSFYFKTSITDADRKYTDEIMNTLKIR